MPQQRPCRFLLRRTTSARGHRNFVQKKDKVRAGRARTLSPRRRAGRVHRELNECIASWSSAESER